MVQTKKYGLLGITVYLERYRTKKKGILIKSAKGCTLYTTWIPCARCAKAIIQAGIIEVIYDNNFPGNKIENQNNWIESMKISKELLLEADIVLRGFSGKLLKVRGLYQGIKYLPEVE